MRLIVGLGNPGSKYAKNRHNVGFMAVEEIASQHHFPPFKKKFNGLLTEGVIDGQKVGLLLPQTFMNKSGDSVIAAMSFFKIKPEDIYVLYDELDLAPGKVRVKKGGGNGGHNGIRSIESHLGKEFNRVRIGIGHPGHKDRVHAYVLGDFAKADHQEWLDDLLIEFGRNADCLANGDGPKLMNKLALAAQARQSAEPAKEPKADAANPKGQSHIRQARQAKKPNVPEKGPMADMLKKLFGKGEN
ncbi:aminoacyl-tRNA hydrolase [Maritalea mediterranea]|uniref:Peptidyl-tRNA hydrolase n=1 Tax=Maritalea mediterranea TaxID=2909667 RepID=A0ABS9E893_9HYPH|nr:aminoacyl-tRNA hydrolase [Maritalea mediterranea]MCF4099066.1 aminoacyl-tRNA hydrolase [Maritalea mediterranea]